MLNGVTRPAVILPANVQAVYCLSRRSTANFSPRVCVPGDGGVCVGVRRGRGGGRAGKRAACEEQTEGGEGG